MKNLKITLLITLIVFVFVGCSTFEGDEHFRNEEQNIDTNTEILKVVDIMDDLIILENGNGEFYYAQDNGTYTNDFVKGRKLLVSYSNKELTDELYYTIEIRWITSEKRFDDISDVRYQISA